MRIREREPLAQGTVGAKALRWEGVLVQHEEAITAGAWPAQGRGVCIFCNPRGQSFSQGGKPRG